MSDFSSIFNDIISRLSGLTSRINRLETLEYIRFYPINASAYLIQTTINAGNTYTSGNLRGTGGISERAKGFVGSLWIDPVDTSATLQICSADETPGTYSQQYVWSGGVDTNRQLMSTMVMCFLSPGGAIRIRAVTTGVNVYLVTFGYWE